MSHLPDDWSGQGSEDGAFARDLPRLADDQLEQLVPRLKRQMDSLHARLALAVAEYDRRGLARERHVLTTKQWFAHTCRVTASEAASTLRTGRALEEMPTTTDHAVAGSITTSALRQLTAARDRHPTHYSLHEAVLAEAATTLEPRDLRRAINHWEQQVSYPTVIAEMENRRRRRRLSINQTWDGMWAISGDLDPDSGVVVSTALRSIADAGAFDDTDDRTPPQKLADALADLCDHHLRGNASDTTSSGSRPQVTVTIDHDLLENRVTATGRLPEVDGVPIDPESVRRLACDASVIPVVLGSQSEVLDVGRATRTIPTALRRALDLRDGGCSWPGCDAPPSWCDAHHVEHWADGGRTTLDNLRLLCRRHHTATHERSAEGGTTSGSDPPD